MFGKNSFDMWDIFKVIIEYGSYIIVLFGCLKAVFKYITEKRYIKKLLIVKGNECYLSQSLFNKNSSLFWNIDFITLSSAKSYQILAEFLLKVDIKAKHCLDGQSIDYKNVIHIGGPASNLHVNSIIINQFDKFKFVTKSENKPKYDRMSISQEFIEFSSEVEAPAFKIRQEFYELTESKDYGIFIRIPPNKKEGRENAVHIIFAGGDLGTLKAVEFFTIQYKAIVREYGNGRYFFMIPISRINNSIDISFNSRIDLTADMFDA